MARIIGGIAASHTPTIGFAYDRNKRDDPVWAPIFENFAPLAAWLAVAIIARDVVIVVGAIAYRIAREHLDIKPTRLSKVNTAIEFAVLLLVMGAAAGWIDATAWMLPSFVIVFVTALASGVQYVWRWGRMAFADRGRTYSDDH